MTLQTLYQSLGGIVAPDGIPLHFGDQKAEYEAAHNAAVLMDRSHEGRLETSGRDRLEIIQRISTNDVTHMANDEGRPTILTSPTGRIIDRLVAYNHGETALITTEPGRGNAVHDYLQRNVFFNDDMRIQDIIPSTKQFALHGPKADAIIQTFAPQAGQAAYLECVDATINDAQVIFLKRKPLVGSQWIIIVPNGKAESVWEQLTSTGQAFGLRPAGSLTFNVLRIESGRPGVGRELSIDFIPLEAGLWDEVSFQKGCYTGQEIIARMESRNRLAKTMVTLQLSELVEAPAKLRAEGREVGTLTSSTLTPNGEAVGIGFVKVPLAEIGQIFEAGDKLVSATIHTLAGAQPPVLENR